MNDRAHGGITIEEAATLAGGRFEGDGSLRIVGVRAPSEAGPDELAVVGSAAYAEAAAYARAVLAAEDAVESLAGSPTAVVIVPDAQRAAVSILERLAPEAPRTEGVHPTAVLGVDVDLGADVSIGPYAVIGDGVTLADGVAVGAHVVIGDGCRIGEDSRLHPHVVLYAGTHLGARVILHAGARVGVDGFGYVPDEGGVRRIPHLGPCVIGDDVEIGANSCVDRGSLDRTEIGRGTKLDNLVHIAHNTHVGEWNLMAALVGIAGSVRIGNGTQWGGQAGCIPHQVVGDGARMTAKAGVTNEVPAGETVMSFPSRPRREHMKALASLYRLDELRNRVKALEERAAEAGDS